MSKPRRVYAAGLVIRDLPVLRIELPHASDAVGLPAGRRRVAIAGIDTRKLTRMLRDKGAQNGA